MLQQLPCLQTTEHTQLQPLAQPVGHPAFYGSLNQQCIEKSCAAQAQSSLALHSLRTAGRWWSSSFKWSHVYKHGFGVDVRSLVPRVVPSAMVSLLQLSDTSTIESDVMGISYWNGFYFVISSIFSTCRWIPHTTCCSPQWWFPGWMPGMHGRRETAWRHGKRTELCEPHKFSLLCVLIFQ